MKDSNYKYKDYNYRYYDHQSTEAFKALDERHDPERAKIHLLDSIARSLAVLADNDSLMKGFAIPKEIDIDLGLAKEDEYEQSNPYHV